MDDIEYLIKELNEKLETKESIKNEILDIFTNKIKNTKYECKSNNCGSEGNYIESLFGIKPNSNCEADYKGFEIKKISKKKHLVIGQLMNIYIIKE